MLRQDLKKLARSVLPHPIYSLLKKRSPQFSIVALRAAPDTWTASHLPHSFPETQSLRGVFDQIERNAAKTQDAGALPLWSGYAALEDYPTDTTKGATRSSNQVRTSQRTGEFYSWLVASHKPSEIVEVGSAFGVSGMYWCAGLVANGTGNFTGFEPNPNWAPYARANIQSVLDRARLVEGAFEDFIDEAPKSIDLAFIDAIHTPEFVETQLGLVLDRARKGTLVVLDDINFSASMREYWKTIQKDSRFAAAFEISERVGVLEVAG